MHTLPILAWILLSALLRLAQKSIPWGEIELPVVASSLSFASTAMLAFCVTYVVYRIHPSRSLTVVMLLGVFLLLTRSLMVLVSEMHQEGHLSVFPIPEGLNRFSILLNFAVYLCLAMGIVLSLIEIHRRNLELESEILRREKADRDNRKLLEEFHEVHRLESLGILAGGIAHDFNNLLTRISGNVGLALEDIDYESPLRTNLLSIEDSVAQGARLAKQMLAYSGKGSFLLEPVNLSDLVREFRSTLFDHLNEETAVHLYLDPHLPPLLADPGQLRQMILNLVTNAAEALPEGRGAIVLSTGVSQRPLEGGGEVQVGTVFEGIDYLYFEITDTGLGMSPLTQKNLFEPFFSTKSSGRGLGLAAVQGIVRGHNGFIQVSTDPGRGSRFCVFFPADPQRDPTNSIPLEIAPVSDPRIGFGNLTLT